MSNEKDMHKTEWKHINLTPRLEKARGEQERLNQMSKGQFMKNIAINTLIQLLGMLGVIGSLIFVGLEMRQSHRFALAGHYEARTNSLLNIVSSFTEGEAGYGDMVRAALGDRIEVEEAHLNGTWQLWFLWENDFMQYELGLMDEAAWTAKLGAMQTAYNACGFRDETDLALNFMVPGMVELVKESFEDHCVN